MIDRSIETHDTYHVKRNGSSRLLNTLTTRLLFVVELMLGPGNAPLMRMTCCGTPNGEMVP